MLFSIEHYFPIDFLQGKDILEAVRDFSDIYTIKDKKKQTFANVIKTETDLKLFEDFKILFDEIDCITDKKTEYLEQ